MKTRERERDKMRENERERERETERGKSTRVNFLNIDNTGIHISLETP